MREGWQRTKLGDVMERRLERVEVDREDCYDLMGIRWKNLGAYKRGDSQSTPSKAKFMYRMRSGDFVFNRIDTDKGAFAIVPPELNMALASNEFPAYRTTPQRLDPQYLWLYFQQYQVLSGLRAAGSEGRARWKETDFEAQTLDLPPLAEQRRIVDLIGAVDEVIEAADESELLERALFSSLLSKVFTEGESVPLASVASLTDCEHNTAPRSEQEIYAHSIGTGDVRAGRVSIANAKPVTALTYSKWTERLRPAIGDIIFTREAPVGELGLVTEELGRVCLGQRTVLIRPKADVSGQYLWLSLLSPQAQRWLRGESIAQTVTRINIKRILQLPVLKLSQSEQVRIVSRATACLELAEASRSHAASLRNLRAEMLATLLSGQHEIPASYDQLLGALKCSGDSASSANGEAAA